MISRGLAVVALLAVAGCPRFHRGAMPGEPAGDEYAVVDGVRLRIIDVGPRDAPTVVLLHGFASSIEAWGVVIPTLAEHRRVIALDLKGFGWSERPPGDYSPQAQAQLVLRLLDQRGVQDAAVVGHSWGASVALALALAAPERVTRLALYDAWAFEDQLPTFFIWARAGGLGELLFSLFYDQRQEDRLALAFYDPSSIPQQLIDDVDRAMRRPGTEAAALATVRGQRYGALQRRYPEVAQPVLLLWGRDDQVTPVRYGERLVAMLPDARLVVYPRCGHLPMIEAAAASTRELAAFLGAGDAVVRAPVLVPSDAVDREAPAAGLAELGEASSPRNFVSPGERGIDVGGVLRARGVALYNLDLDRGLTPSGDPLYPVPVSGGQTLRHADTRLRTDLTARAGAGVAVHLRVDLLDNVTWGAEPRGVPAASPGQEPPGDAFRVKRAYGEIVTPLGLLAVGRMGNQWGLGMLANSGDCADCDGGDAADRVAFVAPVLGHFWAVAYDVAATGPTARRPDGARSIDLEPTDDVRGVTVAVMRYASDLTRARRARAGRATIDYGAYYARRTQDNDVPGDYLPVAQPDGGAGVTEAGLMARGYRATAVDGWLRLTLPWGRIEAEAAVLTAEVEQPSLVPGVLLPEPVTSTQWGAAVQSSFGGVGSDVSFGLDLGIASGDPAPGFGAFPGPTAPAGVEGDLDAPQANPPLDNTVDNFRFHPDYRIDRVLFREIIGTVTDAAYVRPHLELRLLRLGRRATLRFAVAVIAAWALEASSTPGGASALGLEIDPSLYYEHVDGFTAAVEHGLLLPAAGLDNPSAGMSARAAQVWQLRVGYRF